LGYGVKAEQRRQIRRELEQRYRDMKAADDGVAG